MISELTRGAPLSGQDHTDLPVETYSLAGLAQSYAWLGKQLLIQHSVDEVFEALTSVGARQVPGAEQAGITRFHGGVLETVAATDQLVTSTDKIQYALLSGPCVDAVRVAAVFETGDLRSEVQWPEFGPQAFAATGVQSMLSYRLYVEEKADVATSLNFYSTQGKAFDPWAEMVGLLLATHGALAVATALARERNEHLSLALISNREIGVAIGVLMATHKLTSEAALALLRIASQQSNRKMSDVAAEVTETGQLLVPVGAARSPGGQPLTPTIRLSRDDGSKTGSVPPG